MKELNENDVEITIRSPYTKDEQDGNILKLDLEGYTMYVGKEVFDSKIISIKELEKDKFEIKSERIEQNLL